MQIYIPVSLFGAYYHRRTLLLGHAPMNTLQGFGRSKKIHGVHGIDSLSHP
jgi:hypothetical protein